VETEAWRSARIPEGGLKKKMLDTRESDATVPQKGGTHRKSEGRYYRNDTWDSSGEMSSGDIAAG